MIINDNTLYVADLDNELLVFRLGKNAIPCRMSGGIGYRGLRRIVDCDADTLTLEIYYKGLMGKQVLKNKKISLNSIIEFTGLTGAKLEKLKNDFLSKMTNVEVVEDVREIAPWTRNLKR